MVTNLLDQRARLILDDAARSEHFYRERLVFLAAKFFPSMSDTDRARIVTRAVTLHEEAGAPLPDGPPKDDSKLPPVRVYSGPELAELAVTFFRYNPKGTSRQAWDWLGEQGYRRGVRYGTFSNGGYAARARKAAGTSGVRAASARRKARAGRKRDRTKATGAPAPQAGAAPADSTDGAQADFRAEGDPASASENGVTPTPTTETKPMPKKTEAPAPTPPEDTTVMIQRMPGGRVHLVCTGEPREILKVARALLEDAA